MKPPGLRLAERAAPPGQWFRASVSDPKLGIITVRSAPARPVSWPAQPARLAGRSMAYPHWSPRSRAVPMAAQLARGSGGWAPQRLHGSGGRQRQSTAPQQRTSGGQLTYRPATAPARRPIPVCQALARAKISKAGSFLPKSEWRHASTRAPKGHPRPPRPREAEPWTAAEAQPARQSVPKGRGERKLFESHQAARAAQAMCAVTALLAELPIEAADRVLGDDSKRQVPSARRRREREAAPRARGSPSPEESRPEGRQGKEGPAMLAPAPGRG